MPVQPTEPVNVIPFIVLGINIFMTIILMLVAFIVKGTKGDIVKLEKSLDKYVLGVVCDEKHKGISKDLNGVGSVARDAKKIAEKTESLVMSHSH